MRNATAFGYSPRLRADIVLNNLVGHALLSGEVLVLSDGTPWRPLVHAADIARAFAAALTAPREAVHDRAFNIGSEINNVTVAEIAEQVAEAVSGCEGGDHRGDRCRSAVVPGGLLPVPRRAARLRLRVDGEAGRARTRRRLPEVTG